MWGGLVRGGSSVGPADSGPPGGPAGIDPPGDSAARAFWGGVVGGPLGGTGGGGPRGGPAGGGPVHSPGSPFEELLVALQSQLPLLGLYRPQNRQKTQGLLFGCLLCGCVA